MVENPQTEGSLGRLCVHTENRTSTWQASFLLASSNQNLDRNVGQLVVGVLVACLTCHNVPASRLLGHTLISPALPRFPSQRFGQPWSFAFRRYGTLERVCSPSVTQAADPVPLSSQFGSGVGSRRDPELRLILIRSAGGAQIRSRP
ncbi:hypothetical protein VTK73DRAFT_9132 [Phialemonium thermophilum]|uniref:Uncharacterized protein n=1 Tax=Phialemonium thermophilum TaxID=223376 RepID=A0ABR3W489_9PEZI